jgi:hypothetical protein
MNSRKLKYSQLTKARFMTHEVGLTRVSVICQIPLEDWAFWRPWRKTCSNAKQSLRIARSSSVASSVREPNLL